MINLALRLSLPIALCLILAAAAAYRAAPVPNGGYYVNEVVRSGP